MDATDTIFALLTICEPASGAPRPTNPQAASPEELDLMEAYDQMAWVDVRCTCAGEQHIFTDRMCPMTWLGRRGGIQ